MTIPTPDRCHSEWSEESLSEKVETLRFAQGDGLGRRAFFRTALLAGLGWLAVTLLRRSCTNQGVCGSCPAYAGCDLPWRKEAGS